MGHHLPADLHGLWWPVLAALAAVAVTGVLSNLIGARP